MELRQTKGTFAVIGEHGLSSIAWRNALAQNTDLEIRILTRAPEHCFRTRGTAPCHFDLDDPATFPTALAGVDFLGLVTPPHPRQVERELGVIEAAQAAGVGRIINLSVLGANLPAPISAFARWQGEVESALAASSVPWTTLRPASFTDNLLRQKLGIIGGMYVEPLGDARYTSIDTRTIADCVVALTKNPEHHDRQSFDLTGSAALNGEEIAKILGPIVNREVKFASPPIADYRQALAKRGLPDWQVGALCELYEALESGRAPHLATITDDVGRLTGKPPRPFAEAAAFCLLI